MTSDTPRQALHRLCAHVLARRRFAVSGRFGLRAGPAGIATPSYGEGPETLRITGPLLVREDGSDSTRMRIDGSSLRALATFAGADVDAPFDCGADTPAIGDPDEPLSLPAPAVAEIAAWLSLAWDVLDAVISRLGDEERASTIQLWPEHFDAATTLTLPSSVSVNVGFSAGDGYLPEPYVYVGPWEPDRPGDPAFWNAPFGASRPRSQLAESGLDEADSATAFLEAGIALLRGGGA